GDAGHAARRLRHWPGVSGGAQWMAAASVLTVAHRVRLPASVADHPGPLGPGSDRGPGRQGNSFSAVDRRHPVAARRRATALADRTRDCPNPGLCATSGLLVRGLAATGATAVLAAH